MYSKNTKKVDTEDIKEIWHNWNWISMESKTIVKMTKSEASEMLKATRTLGAENS